MKANVSINKSEDLTHFSLKWFSLWDVLKKLQALSSNVHWSKYQNSLKNCESIQCQENTLRQTQKNT